MRDSQQKMFGAAGLLYLIPMFCGPFSMMYVPSVLIVPGDAAATASHLLASEWLLRMGLLSDVAIVLSEVALTAVLFVLFRRVSLTLALVATLARLAMAVLQAVNLLPELAALELVRGAAHLSAIAQPEANALAYALLDLHVMGTHVWEPLFGLHCVVLGALVWRSGEAPRVLGVGLVLAAVGYTVNGLGNLVAPAHAPTFAALVGITAVLGEVPFVVWLLIRGQRSLSR